MREIRLSGSEGGAKLSFVPTPIAKMPLREQIHSDIEFLAQIRRLQLFVNAG